MKQQILKFTPRAFATGKATCATCFVRTSSSRERFLVLLGALPSFFTALKVPHISSGLRIGCAVLFAIHRLSSYLLISNKIRVKVITIQCFSLDVPQKRLLVVTIYFARMKFAISRLSQFGGRFASQQLFAFSFPIAVQQQKIEIDKNVAQVPIVRILLFQYEITSKMRKTFKINLSLYYNSNKNDEIMDN